VARRASGLVITDLDNTLYDWVGFYVPAFLSMLDQASRISGVGASELEHDFQNVHRDHGTTEYAFSLQELPSLRSRERNLSPREFLAKYDPAIHAFRSERKRLLKLYPDVRDALLELRARGVTVVAHSDAFMGYVSRRLRQLDVDTLVAAVSAPADHGIPEGLPTSAVVKSEPRLVEARCLQLPYPARYRKPEVNSLIAVQAAFKERGDHTVYVGDSLSRDVLLARRAGLVDAWARYGTDYDPALYAVLLRISYWSEAEVRDEERLRTEAAKRPPTHTLSTFSDILAIIGALEG
jgi:FMN phosphatase YigB (HAD superfamily)